MSYSTQLISVLHYTDIPLITFLFKAAVLHRTFAFSDTCLFSCHVQGHNKKDISQTILQLSFLYNEGKVLITTSIIRNTP